MTRGAAGHPERPFRAAAALICHRHARVLTSGMQYARSIVLRYGGSELLPQRLCGRHLPPVRSAPFFFPFPGVFQGFRSEPCHCCLALWVKGLLPYLQFLWPLAFSPALSGSLAFWAPSSQGFAGIALPPRRDLPTFFLFHAFPSHCSLVALTPKSTQSNGNKRPAVTIPSSRPQHTQHSLATGRVTALYPHTKGGSIAAHYPHTKTSASK